CYGITVGSKGRLRATRLLGGESPDSVIMNGPGDVVLRDSDYMISLTAAAVAGGSGVFDFPIAAPITRVYDRGNIPGAEYRLELVNTRVPLWFLFLRVAQNGPETEIVLRDCPRLIPSVMGRNLQGKWRLPCLRRGDPASLPLLHPHSSLRLANVTLRTLERPAGISTWGVYLNGPKTDITLTGPTLICELMVTEGKATLAGTPGTFDAATTATTVEVGAFGPADPCHAEAVPGDAPPVAELLIRNAEVGRFDRAGILGQIGAYRNARVRIEDARTADLRLITHGNATIELRRVQLAGRIERVEKGGAIRLEPDSASPATGPGLR
ncbi:MAG: hypothetical protein N3D11_16410, partial [Candidatus Sumerlaeia bacterium]|nr:hypothetical protein [Candidatus Sumerlaeia bacterium]